MKRHTLLEVLAPSFVPAPTFARVVYLSRKAPSTKARQRSLSADRMRRMRDRRKSVRQGPA